MVSLAAVRALIASDTVVIGGGGMFGRGLPPLVACLPFVLLGASYLGKEIELRSVGAYPDMPAPVGWALRRVVRRARHTSARDTASVVALGGPDRVTRSATRPGTSRPPIPRRSARRGRGRSRVRVPTDRRLPQARCR